MKIHDNLLHTFLFFNFLSTTALFLAWKRSDPLNFVIKIVFLDLAVGSLYFLLRT